MTDERSQGAREGGCSCGAIRFRAAGAPLWTAHCHCRDCRRATGAPVATYAGFATGRVAFIQGAPAERASSPGVRRGWCAACGSPMFYAAERWPEEIHLFVATFDDPDSFTPESHVYVDESLSWFPMDDGLPRKGGTA